MMDFFWHFFDLQQSFILSLDDDDEEAFIVVIVVIVAHYMMYLKSVINKPS